MERTEQLEPDCYCSDSDYTVGAALKCDHMVIESLGFRKSVHISNCLMLGKPLFLGY